MYELTLNQAQNIVDKNDEDNVYERTNGPGISLWHPVT
jgi:hypothetical protein